MADPSDPFANVPSPLDDQAAAQAAGPFANVHSPLDDWERIPLGLGSAALKGLETGIGSIGDVENFAGVRQAYGSPVGRALMSVLPIPYLPTSSELVAESNKLGATNNPALAPQSTAEKYGQVITSGVASAVPLAFTGGSALPLLLAGGTGAAAEQATRDINPNLPSWVAPTVGGLAGLSAGSVVNPLLRYGPEAAARTLGGAGTLQEAGDYVRGGIDNWLEKVFPEKEAAAWAPIDETLKASNPPVTLSNFESTLQNLRSNAGGLQSLADEISPQLPKRMGKVLDNMKSIAGLTDGEATSEAEDLTAPFESNWNDARKFRSILGKAINNPGVLKDLPQEQATALYRGITSDLGDTATAAGQGENFAAANAESTRLRGIVDDIMQPIRDAPTGGQAAARLISQAGKDSTVLQTLQDEGIPVGNLASHILRANPSQFAKLAPETQEMFIPDEGQRNSLLTEINAGKRAAPGGKLGALLGGTVGSAIGGLTGAAAQHFMPELGLGHAEWPAAWAGEVLGAAAPGAWSMVRRAGTNPLTGVAGAVGGNAASQ
jgi:hypothetical protein